MKKNKAIVSFLLVLVLCFALSANTIAFYAKPVSVNSNSCKTVSITTGSGLWYALGWQKTKFYIQNTGKYPCYVYCDNRRISTLKKGYTLTIVFSGSGKRHLLGFKKVNGNTSVSLWSYEGKYY